MVDAKKLAYALRDEELIGSYARDIPDVTVERWAARIAAALDAAREQAIRDAEAAFQDEYCNHKEPLIGVIRGLKAIQALRAADRPRGAEPAKDSGQTG
jgi:hypothetical protein